MASAWGLSWFRAWGNAWGQWSAEILIFPRRNFASGSAARRAPQEPRTRPRKRRREEDEALLFGALL